ncbi:hypothetical protein [Anaerococcus obesiensis]|nr:hypothetical protein [Anaerococcus obesiensis]
MNKSFQIARKYLQRFFQLDPSLKIFERIPSHIMIIHNFATALF